MSQAYTASSDFNNLRSLVGGSWRLFPHTFAEVASEGAWKPYPHLVHTMRIVGDEIARGGGRIIVNMPPRHGKTEALTRWLGAWHMERRPDKNVIVVSYNANYATDLSRKIRDTVNRHPKFTARFRADVHGAASAQTTKGGNLFSAGAGGAITGRGGDLLILDDPHKNWEEAHSATNQAMLRDWFNSTFYTRAEPGATIVVAMTRWCAGDITDWLLREHGDKWTVINLPAIALDNDPMGRAPGEALAPERYPVESLRMIRTAIRERKWLAMYQQRPEADVAGALWTEQTINANRVKIAPGNYKRVVVAIDPSASETGDEAGIIGMGMSDNGHRYVLADRSRADSPNGWARVAITLFVELDADCIVAEKNNGGDMISTVVLAVAKSMGVRVKVKLVHASRGKITRAEPTAAAYERGEIHHIGHFPELESQLRLMTVGGYAGEGSPDHADALVWADTELCDPSVGPSTAELMSRISRN